MSKVDAATVLVMLMAGVTTFSAMVVVGDQLSFDFSLLWLTELLTGINYASANPYFLTFITTIVAALSASVIVFVMDWWRSQRVLLAELNSLRVILVSYKEQLLFLLRDHVVPEAENMEQYRKEVGQGIAPDVAFSKYRSERLKSSPRITYKGLASHADKAGEFQFDGMRNLIWSQEAIHVIVSNIDLRNDLIEQSKRITPDSDRLAKQLGLPDSSRVMDTDIYDLTTGNVVLIENAIYFLYNALLFLDVLTQKALCGTLQKRTVKFQAIDEEIQEYLNSVIKKRH